MSAGPEHGTAALAGTVASGIRSRFCYGISPIRAAEWTADSLALDRDPQPAWVPSQLREWSSRLPLTADDRVRLGFFFDSYFLPRDTIRDTLAHVKTLGIDFISSHFRHWPISAGKADSHPAEQTCKLTSTGQAKIPEILDECGHLGPDVLLTHGNGLTPEQASLLTAAGTYICSTPDAEISMASGADPVAFRPDLPLTCLGADCHSCGPSSMLHQMQTALSADRGAQTSRTFAEGHYPRRFQATVQRAFNLATIQGARAVGMADQIGSIAVGKLADLVILDASTPSMGCAAHNDPLTAVVRQASVREVDTVIVGGRVCKRDGKLVDVDVSEACGKVGYPLPGGGDGSWSWSQVAEKLRVSRDAVHERIGKVNKELAKKTLHGMMGGLDEILVDP